jgi:hypothetical protein
MTLLLRKQRAQDRIEGRDPFGWKEDDYAVVDETRIGRIYKEQLPAGEKWRWFLNGALLAIPPGIQASGSADTLEQAKAEIAAQYAAARATAGQTRQLGDVRN